MSSVPKVLFSNVYAYVIKQNAYVETVKMKVKHLLNVQNLYCAMSGKHICLIFMLLLFSK